MNLLASVNYQVSSSSEVRVSCCFIENSDATVAAAVCVSGEDPCIVVGLRYEGETNDISMTGIREE